MVVKGDRSREAFDEAKLRAGMEKALEKRPVPREQFDEAVSRITPQAAQPRRARGAVARRSASS